MNNYTPKEVERILKYQSQATQMINDLFTDMRNEAEDDELEKRGVPDYDRTYPKPINPEK